MILTDKQNEALELTKKVLHTLLYGGSRSGKTALLVYLICIRAIKYTGSRHLIARLKFNHVKTSIWLDTLPKVLTYFKGSYKLNQTNHFVKFYNDSEIWVDGLDDKERVEKILGREYNTIYYNEVSQIPYDSVELTYSRLSLQTPGCSNKFFYDLNPTTRFHWSYKLFIQKINPKTNITLPYPDFYGHMRLNPGDNKENLASGYIETTLENLSHNKRQRFLLGEWTTPEGVIFDNWTTILFIPPEIMTRAKLLHGLDFGFSVDPAAFIRGYYIPGSLYLEELIYQTGLTNKILFDLIIETGIKKQKITADNNEPKTIEEFYLKGLNIHPAVKGKDSIMFGIDFLLTLKIYITEKSINLQNEFSSYTYDTDKNGRTLRQPIDDFNHGIDATRYMTEEIAIKQNEFIPIKSIY